MPIVNNVFEIEKTNPELLLDWLLQTSGPVKNKGLEVVKTSKRRRGRRRKEKHNSTKRRSMRKRFIAVDPHCFYCNAELTFEYSTLDHVIPVSKGGDIKNNLVLSCEKCNNLKADVIDVNIDMNRVYEINRKVEELKQQDMIRNGSRK